MELQDRCLTNQTGTFTIKEIDLNKDYKDLCKWFEFYKWPPLPKEIFPKTTFILHGGGFKIASICLYIPQSGNIGFAEWYVINPEAPRHLRKDSINKLLNHISAYAKKEHCKTLFSSVANPHLLKKIKDNGFQETDKMMTNLIKIL